MGNAPLILLHWEAFSPYADIQMGIEQHLTSKAFPRDQLRMALPYDYLQQANTSLAENGFCFGANDMLSAVPHAFTESIAITALQKVKAAFVLLGKASQRHAPNSHPDAIKHKLQAALQNQLPVFFCFGNSGEEADVDRTSEIMQTQLKAAFEGVAPELLSHVHFVYDTPTSFFQLEDIQNSQRDQIHDLCRQQYVALWGDAIADTLKTLCALPAHMPIPKTFFDHSPFTGIYFKMVDADLTWLRHELPANQLAIKPVEKAAAADDHATGDEEVKFAKETIDKPAAAPEKGKAAPDGDAA